MLKPETNPRPTRVTLLAWLAFAIALWNGIRLVQAIIFRSVLKEYQAAPGPLYAAVSGGFWLLTGLAIAWGLWRGKSWAWFATLGGAAGYGSWYWFDRLILQKPHSNGPFALVTTVVILFVILLILFSPRARKYFSNGKKKHEN